MRWYALYGAADVSQSVNNNERQQNKKKKQPNTHTNDINLIIRKLMVVVSNLV